MNEKGKCPRCGGELPSDSPEGLCPRCLGALNLESETEASGEAAPSWTPPPVSELAPLFPQLEVLNLIGRGGMGAVYKARQKVLDRMVALKILPPGVGQDPAFAERFTREAKALARLSHAGIVTIHDFGRTDGLYFLIMEFVDGVNLGQLIAGGRMSPREALAVVPEICDALQYAHDQGIVHRDIKPANILLDRRGRVKVADFGLAKLIGGEDETAIGASGKVSPALTEAGKVMGTPEYMAPEQVEHPAAVDHRADIYALGVVFYQMLTGELPGKPLEPPSRKVRLDVRLDEVVLRALEREPERRYQQASQVKTAVETVTRAATSNQESKLAEDRQTPQIGVRKARYTPLRLILGLALVTLVALVLWWMLRVMGLKYHEPQPVAGPAPLTSVVAFRAERGDVGDYIHCLGEVESSNSVVFSVSENYVQEIVHKVDAGQRLPVDAYDRQGGTRFGHGFLVAVDNAMDTATGTLKCKAMLQPDGGNSMIPGTFLDIYLLLQVKHEVIRVPEQAVERDRQSTFVWAITPEDKLTRRTIQVGTVEEKLPPNALILQRLMAKRGTEAESAELLQQWAEIQSGLAPGELVVIGPQGANLQGVFENGENGRKVQVDLVSRPQIAASQNTASPPDGNPPLQQTQQINNLQAGQSSFPGTPSELESLQIQTLDHWLADLQSPESKVQKMAQLALKDMGPNALPGILKVLNESNDLTITDRQLTYAEAIQYIGPGAKSALPAFTTLLKSGQQQAAYSAAAALAFSIPNVSEAFSILTNALTDPSPGVRDAASYGMGFSLSEPGFTTQTIALAETGLPLLVRNLKDPVDYVRADTARVLADFTQRQCQRGRPEPDFLIPPLIDLLQDKYSHARYHAVRALSCSCFGDKLKPWLPSIQKLQESSDTSVRQSATNLLQKLQGLN